MVGFTCGGVFCEKLKKTPPHILFVAEISEDPNQTAKSVNIAEIDIFPAPSACSAVNPSMITKTDPPTQSLGL